MIIELIIWLVCMLFVLWQSWGTWCAIRQNPSASAKSLLFTGMLWVGLVGYASRFLQSH